jgi:hypothetical protein
VVPRDAAAFHRRGPGGDAQRVDQQRRGGVERGVGNIEWAEREGGDVVERSCAGHLQQVGRSPGTGSAMLNSCNA